MSNSIQSVATMYPRRGGIYIFKLYVKIHLQNIFTTINLTLTMFCGIPDFLSLLGCVHIIYLRGNLSMKKNNFWLLVLSIVGLFFRVVACYGIAYLLLSMFAYLPYMN